MEIFDDDDSLYCSEADPHECFRNKTALIVEITVLNDASRKYYIFNRSIYLRNGFYKRHFWF